LSSQSQATDTSYVLFEIGQINVFAGKVRYYPEGRNWCVSQGAVQVAYDVCAALVLQDYYHWAEVLGMHLAVESFLDCCVAE
jgi:hypothetical protein